MKYWEILHPSFQIYGKLWFTGPSSTALLLALFKQYYVLRYWNTAVLRVCRCSICTYIHTHRQRSNGKGPSNLYVLVPWTIRKCSENLLLPAASRNAIRSKYSIEAMYVLSTPAWHTIAGRHSPRALLWMLYLIARPIWVSVATPIYRQWHHDSSQCAPKELSPVQPLLQSNKLCRRKPTSS